MHEIYVDGDDAESRLFKEWLATGTVNKEKFTDDGIVSAEHFGFWNPRIVFVLKEVNTDHCNGFSLRSFLAAGAKNEGGYKDGSRTWAPIQRWLAKYGREIDCSGKIQVGQNNRKTVLRTIAAINLNKLPGGSTTDNAQLAVDAKSQGDLIRKQVETYYGKPTVFACCGTPVFGLFAELMGIPKDSTVRIDGIDFRNIAENVYAFNVGHHPNRSVQKLHDVRFVKAMLAIRKHIAESSEIVNGDGKVS